MGIGIRTCDTFRIAASLGVLALAGVVLGDGTLDCDCPPGGAWALQNELFEKGSLIECQNCCQLYDGDCSAGELEQQIMACKDACLNWFHDIDPVQP